VVVSDGGALGSTLPSTAAVRTGGVSWHDLLVLAANVWVKNPKGFGFYL
jgi:hypothetical protein